MLVASAGNVLVWIVWLGAAFACLASGVAVVSFSNPFFSALALIGNLASLAVLYLLLSAEFVAAAQVLVYAGAVMVMFLFVIAYLGGRADAPWAGGAALPAARRRGRVPLRDRRARRPPAPQPADRPALARDHAERREPGPDRLRAPPGERRRADLRPGRHGRGRLGGG